MLQFYGLFKQCVEDSRTRFILKFTGRANVGDVDTKRPGGFDFAGKYKWDAWKKNEGISKEDAQQKYAEKLIEVLKASDSDEAKQYLQEVSMQYDTLSL